MSSQEAVARLAEPLRNLVLAAAKDTILFGSTEKDIAEVKTWVEKASHADAVNESNIKVAWKSCLDLLVLALTSTQVARRTFGIANIPRQQLSDSSRRCYLWSITSYHCVCLANASSYDY